MRAEGWEGGRLSGVLFDGLVLGLVVWAWGMEHWERIRRGGR